MKKRFFAIGIAIIALFFGNAYSQTETTNVKKVAILECVDKIGDVVYGHRMLLRTNITNAINKTQGYQAIARLNLASIMDEQKFQRSGYVSDQQIKKIGELNGATHLLIAEVANYSSTEVVVNAQLINVETGQIENTSEGIPVNFVDAQKMKLACDKIAAQLLGAGTKGTSAVGPGSRSDFTEDAWGINMRMVWVEGGDFLMGCTAEQGGDCESDEKNVRRVTVDGFYIGMLEVTQSQWEKVMGTSVYQQKNKANPDWSMRGVGPDYPMYYVSCGEAMEFCRLLSRQTGKTYTLPTEAQWEYAARGGAKNEGTKYSGSNVIDVVAWYDGNSGSNTHVCGSKRANALGIYDMSGNVWEWCKDWYGNSYISYDVNNPVGPSSGSYRVLRGGSWYDSARHCRVADRSHYSPGYRHNHCGFRVVLLP